MALRARRVMAGVLALVVVLSSCSDSTGGGSTDAPRPGLSVAWSDGAGPVAAGSGVELEVNLSGEADLLEVRLRNARPLSIPAGCVGSDVKRLRSFLDGRRLVCVLDDAVASLTVDAYVDGSYGAQAQAVVTATGGGATERAEAPRREVSGGTKLRPDPRLVSSPDFVNGDVGDLRGGPGRWDPSRSANGTSPAYEDALDGVLDDWVALDPAAVLVAGDLVNGRWGFDDQRTGTFGPVRTLAQRKAAFRRAARTYYPQWQQRFDARGLTVYPTLGDHELSDSPFTPTKRRLAPTARREFARFFTTNPDGSPGTAEGSVVT